MNQVKLNNIQSKGDTSKHPLLKNAKHTNESGDSATFDLLLGLGLTSEENILAGQENNVAAKDPKAMLEKLLAGHVNPRKSKAEAEIASLESTEGSIDESASALVNLKLKNLFEGTQAISKTDTNSPKVNLGKTDKMDLASILGRRTSEASIAEMINDKDSSNKNLKGTTPDSLGSKIGEPTLLKTLSNNSLKNITMPNGQALKELNVSPSLLLANSNEKNSKTDLDAVLGKDSLKVDNHSPFKIANAYKNETIIGADNIIKFNNAFAKEKSDTGKLLEKTMSTSLSPLESSTVTNVIDFKASQNFQNSPNLTLSVPILDLGNIPASNTDALIAKIAQYIDQNRVVQSGSLSLDVKHPELGSFSIKVQKGANVEDLAIKISSASSAAQDFFVKNEGRLMDSLSQSGIKVSELKIISTVLESFVADNSQSQTKQESSGQDNSRQFTRGQSLGYRDQQSQDQADSERRRNLWKMYEQRAEA